jgi:hypothetical protein
MGSSRTRNSISVTKARSSKTKLKHRHKPTKLRKAADALRAIKHARSSRSADPLQMSPTQLVRDMRDGMPTTVLHYIRKNLKLIQSAAIVVAHALREQNVELDDDAADVLRRHVSDSLQDQIETIDSLIGGSE